MKKLFIKDLELRRSFSAVPITTLAIGEEGREHLPIKRPDADPGPGQKPITMGITEGGTDPK